jgi:hypothetical protein
MEMQTAVVSQPLRCPLSEGKQKDCGHNGSIKDKSAPVEQHSTSAPVVSHWLRQ